MKKQVLTVAALGLALSVTASAWESLTHAYLMERIKDGAANTSANERYGITTPDFFNFLLGSPYRDYLYDQTHENFMRVWHQSGNGMKGTPQEQLAMGLVCHNGIWGTDVSAHSAAFTTDHAKGYVIAKAETLEGDLAPLWQELHIDGPEHAPLRREICHEVVEIVIDVQVWRLDKGLGARYLQSAMTRDGSIRDLLASAYAGGLADFSTTTPLPIDRPTAALFLGQAESGYRMQMMYYATIFNTTNEDAVLTGLGGYLAQVAREGYGLQVSPAAVKGLLSMVLGSNITSDLLGELDATVASVKAALAAHKVVYGPKGQ
jgi:hypothetical protein